MSFPCMQESVILIFTIIYFFVNFHESEAQQNNTFYLMHEVPQSNFLNPAVQINCKWFVAIPALGSTHINISNSTFSFNELFSTNNGLASLDMSSLYENARNTNLINTETHLDLISIGYRRNEYYFNFNIAEKVNVAATYPRSIIELAWKGNTQFLGETAEFNNLRTHSVYYREYSLGVSKVWDSEVWSA